MYEFPIDSLNFFVKFGEIMLEITRAEVLYETNLRDISRELVALYFKWTGELLVRRTGSDYYNLELERLEFSVHKKICENIIERSSDLVAKLDRLFFIDTSELNIAISKAKWQKTEAERSFAEEGNHQKGIELMKNTVDNLFEAYNDKKAIKRNLERNALKKWCALLGGIYFPAMLVYFSWLNYMKIKPDFTCGIVVPVFSAVFLLMPLFVIFSSEE